jgi:hypothetical protein
MDRKIKTATKLDWNGEQRLSDVEKATIKRIETAAIQIQSAVKADMQASTGGRRYKRPARTHVASRPGEPPAVDTGTLVRSVQIDRSESRSKLRVFVGTGLKYAVYLAKGTGRMAPRPVWVPVLRRLRRRFLKSFEGAI